MSLSNLNNYFNHVRNDVKLPPSLPESACAFLTKQLSLEGFDFGKAMLGVG